MKSTSAVLLLALCAFVYAQPQHYTTKYDKINLDQILGNNRLLRSYVNCLVDKGTCTKDAIELKKVIPDAIQTNCSKCSEEQRNGAKKITNYLIEHRRTWWNELEAKYDREGIYRQKYEKELKKEGFKV